MVSRSGNCEGVDLGLASGGRNLCGVCAECCVMNLVYGLGMLVGNGFIY